MLKHILVKDELRLLWPFYLAIFLDSAFSVLSAYFVLYFLSIGFSVSQIAFLESAYFFAIFFFDILTGAIADIYGRKVSVVLSSILTGTLSLIVPFVKEFYILLAIYIIWGVVRTLATGSDEAWIVSNIKAEKKGKLIARFYSKYSSIANLGGLVSALLAVLIVSVLGMKYLWTVQGVGLIIASLVLLVPKEHFKRRKVVIEDSYKHLFKQAKDSVSYASNHAVIFKIILASFFFVIVLNGMHILWQPILKGLEMPLNYFGYFFSVSFAIGVVVPIISSGIGKRFSKKSRYLALLLTITFFTLLIVYLSRSYVLGVLSLLAYYALYDSFRPIERPFMQRFIPNKMRATIGSFKSTMNNLGAGFSSFIVGLISSFASPKSTLLVLSLFLIPSIYFYMRIKKH